MMIWLALLMMIMVGMVVVAVILRSAQRIRIAELEAEIAAIHEEDENTHDIVTVELAERHERKSQ